MDPIKYAFFSQEQRNGSKFQTCPFDMPYDDGILKINCYSLTDLHDFDECSFRFYVRHHLDCKYDIDEGNPQIALGNLLDQTIKLFHKTKAYGEPLSYMPNLVMGAKNLIFELEKKRKRPNFYSTTVPFLDEAVTQRAIQIFTNFYSQMEGKINPAIDEVGFCEWVIRCDKGVFKLWGGPDTLEMAADGIPEVVDYKSRENIVRGKSTMDMHLMPKIYVLLCAEKLLKKGYKQARFRVRFWQDPLEDSFFEEYDLEELKSLEKVFEEKICQILDCQEVNFCGKRFCPACNSGKREEFIGELKKLGLKIISEEVFLLTNLEQDTSPLIIEAEKAGS